VTPGGARTINSSPVSPLDLARKEGRIEGKCEWLEGAIYRARILCIWTSSLGRTRHISNDDIN
jgi:hypothetical protein